MKTGNIFLIIIIICLFIMVVSSFLIGLETGKRLPKATTTINTATTAIAVNARLITHKDMMHPIYTDIPDGKIVILEERATEYMVQYVPTGQFGFINKAHVIIDESYK